MKHRVQIDISFDSEQEAVSLLNYIENIKDKAFKPTGTEKISCFRQCRYHECSHEEIEPVQCTDYVDVEFDAEKKAHKLKEKTP